MPIVFAPRAVGDVEFFDGDLSGGVRPAAFPHEGGHRRGQELLEKGRLHQGLAVAAQVFDQKAEAYVVWHETE